MAAAAPGTAVVVLPVPPPTDEVVCSAKGCREEAVHALVWRNPGIHRGERTKTWVACDAHRESLSAFLARKDFLLRVEPLASPRS